MSAERQRQELKPMMWQRRVLDTQSTTLRVGSYIGVDVQDTGEYKCEIIV